MPNKYPNPFAACQQVGKFEKVSKENYDNLLKLFVKDYADAGDPVPEFTSYDEIVIPKRKTEDSAGYDICVTHDIYLGVGRSIVVPTFIRAYIKRGWMLKLYPRSSCGFKYNMKLANTVGIVDGDYYHSQTDSKDNEGHIMIKIVNEGSRAMHLKKGERFCQAVFEMYGVTFSDDIDEKEVRSGGIGSTGTT